jgi:hypothetical protein
MAIWEYKVISSGRGGFASPAHLEKFLNDLGGEDWEIIEFRTPPDNPLAFSGLARRPTQRDWTLEDAAAAAARTEADKLRAEFEAKFKGLEASGSMAASSAEAPAATEKQDDGLRQLRDTERDQDPDAPDEEPKDEWDLLRSEEELPTFFEAIRPHMRRNQRGPGMSVGVDYLVKKWEFSEDDLKAALQECGFTVPDDEDAKPEYLEYDGDLYWVNMNRRGELWINTKEKPRPVFRVAQGQRVAPEETAEGNGGGEEAEKAGAEEAQASDGQDQRGGGRERRRGRDRKRGDSKQEPEGPPEPLPEGPALLEKLYSLMRRNRRSPGRSGSTTFLARALRCPEDDLKAALVGLGLAEPTEENAEPPPADIGSGSWFLNRDQRGGLWINGRLKVDGDDRSEEEASADEQPAADAVSGAGSTEAPVQQQPDGTAGRDALLSAVRPHLTETKSGSHGAEIFQLASALGRDEPDLVASLSEAGLKVPEKPREKRVRVGFGGEDFWFSRNSKGEIWLNAKASKSAGDAGEEDSSSEEA